MENTTTPLPTAPSVFGGENGQNSPVSHTKTDAEIMAELEAKAQIAAELNAKERRMVDESEAAQLEIVSAKTLAESKIAAADEDTWRVVQRLVRETLPLNLDLARKDAVPDTDVLVLVIPMDNTRIPIDKRLGQTAFINELKVRFPEQFGQLHRWRLTSYSVKHDTLNQSTLINREGGLLPTIFKLVQGAHAHRARNIYPQMFKSPERPNRIVQPRQPFQPQLHINPEVG